MARWAVRVLAICLALVASTAAAAPEELQIRLTTAVPFAEIRPDRDAAAFTLTVTDAAGRLVPARLHLALQAPRSGWFSTDFPLVEATDLFAGEVLAPDGRYTFTYLPPMRGQYRLQVEAWPLGATAAEPTRGTLTFTLRETPDEWRNLALLLSGLLVVGVVSGFIIGRSARALGPGAGALLALCLWLLAAAPARAHERDDLAFDFPAAESNGEIAVRLELTPHTSATGRLTEIQGAVTDPHSGQPVPNAQITLAMIHAEDGIQVFRTLLPAPGGEFNWRHQFWDGAPHYLEIQVTPGPGGSAFTPLTRRVAVDVEGAAPPAAVKVKLMAWLLGVMTLGMLGGYRWGLRQRPPR